MKDFFFPKHDLQIGIGIANSIFRLALIAFWKKNYSYTVKPVLSSVHTCSYNIRLI